MLFIVTGCSEYVDLHYLHARDNGHRNHVETRTATYASKLDNASTRTVQIPVRPIVTFPYRSEQKK